MAAEIGFELFDLVAYGDVGQAEFVGGAAKTAEPGGCFESLERAQRRQRA